MEAHEDMTSSSCKGQTLFQGTKELFGPFLRSKLSIFWGVLLWTRRRVDC